MPCGPTEAVRAALALSLVVAAAAGCTGSSDQKPIPDAASSPPPANYKGQIAQFLRVSLTDRSDFKGAMIAPPALKMVGPSQHYVVCVRFNPRSELKEKVVVYLGDSITQFVDSKPDQCAGAAYVPYQDLEDVTPPK